MTDAFDEEIVECLQRLVELLCKIGPNPRKLKVGGLQVCLRPRLITAIQEGAERGVTITLCLLPIGLPACLWIDPPGNIARDRLRDRTRAVRGEIGINAEPVAVAFAVQPVVGKRPTEY